ncbi:hypothetical protein EPUL_001382 [Erysiphe pulchra]|uniref:DNA-(apurinic or apyrimidinic site) endonuclease 2 n=1 Tax=Erysiphe pulchra TaxID=225359 RepID=A0A2S4PX64_9PEZI|nr:hypothetical protein EPUL_001382 [Erysiphe pulchra]
MFDILEADIIIMQEIKIQRKDLQDDMVLIPGWDVFFSFPKYKKGYSGVAIYTRSDFCAPIRAEEGITGILTPSNCSTSYRDLPIEQQIGGYPTSSQLSDFSLDASTLDSEGRCVIIEFPAFILIGTYCPAARDSSRDEFRLGFLNALDARVRNLVNAGKKVFLAGDLNIVREEIDSIYAEEMMKKCGGFPEEFLSCPIRRIFNQLIVDGKVLGDRDKDREKPVLIDICRSFHPSRRKMFTCWDQKTNARPANLGSRIDYVLCSQDWKDWFYGSDIQEGLMGSDHCPVYAVLNKTVHFDGKKTDIKDIMSNGLFKNGIRQRKWCTKDLLPLSGKLLPEFDRRRNIKEMFAKSMRASNEAKLNVLPSIPPKQDDKSLQKFSSLNHETQKNNFKNVNEGQSNLSQFFKKTTLENESYSAWHSHANLDEKTTTADPVYSLESSHPSSSAETSIHSNNSPEQCENTISNISISCPKNVPNTKDTKGNWAKFLSKHVAPRCKHGEPCISHITKKPGMNYGRSFFICPRPLGPSGQDEKDSIWRCSTFIWKSDWNGAM